MSYAGIPPELRFLVEEYDERGRTPIELIAACKHIDGARAAFKAACEQFPDRKFGVSQGMRVIQLNFEMPRSVD